VTRAAGSVFPPARSLSWKVFNFLALQGAWFACVLGSAADVHWPGYLVTAGFIGVHFAFLSRSCTGAAAYDRRADLRADVRLAGTAFVFGAVVETVNRATGVVVPASDLLPAPLSPLWLLCLWVAFALVVRHSMAWMSGKFFLGALFGAVFGPLSWYGGERLGAVSLASGPVPAWVVLGVEWAIAMPVLLAVAGRRGGDRDRVVAGR
jgi:hypothetical protein